MSSSVFGLAMSLCNSSNEGTSVLMGLLCIITFLIGLSSED